MGKLTTKQIADLNGSMEANRLASVGSMLGGFGTYTVLAADVNASAIILDAPVSSISGWIVNINRSGSTVTSNVKVSGLSASRLTLTSGSQPGYTMVAGDLVNYIIM